MIKELNTSLPNTTKPPRQSWGESELSLLKEKYPNTYTCELSTLLGKNYYTVRNMAKKLGLKKSEAFVKFKQEERAKALRVHGAKTRFKEKHPSYNSGRPMPDHVRQVIARNMFKEGHTPYNLRPEGSERVNRYGIIVIKIGGNWIPKQIHIWQQHNGPVLKGYVIAFKEKGVYAIENLEMLTRHELMFRNRKKKEKKQKEKKEKCPTIGNGEKKCSKCGQSKEADKHFYKKKNTVDGYMYQCKSCADDTVRAHKEEKLGRQIKRYAPITEEQEQFLKDNYLKIPVAETMVAINMPEAKIYYYASKMGLKRVRVKKERIKKEKKIRAPKQKLAKVIKPKIEKVYHKEVKRFKEKVLPMKVVDYTQKRRIVIDKKTSIYIPINATEEEVNNILKRYQKTA